MLDAAPAQAPSVKSHIVLGHHGQYNTMEERKGQRAFEGMLQYNVSFLLPMILEHSHNTFSGSGHIKNKLF